MQTEPILDAIEEAVTRQVAVGAGGDAVEEAAGAVMAALRPAVRQAAYQLAEQAAAEVDAQLTGYTVSVMLDDGEPSLLVREEAATQVVAGEDLSARITLRLPDALKDDLEAAAGELGESVNSFVIKTLARRSSHRSARRITDTFET